MNENKNEHVPSTYYNARCLTCMSSVTLKPTWSLSQMGRLTCPGSQPAAARGQVWAQDGWLEAPNLLRAGSGGQERNQKRGDLGASPLGFHTISVWQSLHEIPGPCALST